MFIQHRHCAQVNS